MRRLLLVAALLACIGMTTAVADGPLKPFAQTVESKEETAEPPSSKNATVVALEEELEILEAQLKVKKGYFKIAEIDVSEAKQALDNAARGEDMQTVKQELETANAQLEIKSGELMEVEVKIKYAKQRLSDCNRVLALRAKGREIEASRLVMMGVVGMSGVPLLAGLAEIEPQPTRSSTGSKIAVFNMAAVMKQFEKAKYKVSWLTEEKNRLMVEVVRMREDLSRITKEVQGEQNPAKKDELVDQQRKLARQIEDSDRRIQKQLNEKASVIIGTLHDEIQSVVEKISKTNGYDIVFAYPDATTPEELHSSFVKELKLKPPAAQPFVVTKQVDLTEAIVKELNTRYPPKPDSVKRDVD